MSNTISSTSYSSSSSSSIIPTTADRLKQRQVMRIEQMVVQALNLESTLIDNEGEVAGKRLESQNALKDQDDNEQEYKKQQRHKIFHAIISCLAHVINLVMIVVRPVKSLVKNVKKGIKKGVSKASSKILNKTADHVMKHIGSGMKHRGPKGGKLVKTGLKVLEGVAEHNGKSGVFSNFMKSDFGRLVKRQGLVNGVAAAVNGIGDGITNVQIAKIEKRVEVRENQNELIESNAEMLEQQKKQQLDNGKQINQLNEGNIKLANAAIKNASDISSAFINQAA